MANYCNNFLEFNCTEIPPWFKVGIYDTLQLPFSDYYWFWVELTVELNEITNLWKVSILFQTKYNPPLDLYEQLLTIDTVTDIYADYSEPADELIGYFNKEWNHIIDWPKNYWSEVLWYTVYLTHPEDMFIHIEWDEYHTFESYLEAMYQEDNNDGVFAHLIENEIKECAEFFKLNLEDQQWVELIASFNS